MTDKAAVGDRMRRERLRAGEMFEQGTSVPEVARALQIGLGTAYAWRGKWREGGVERLKQWHSISHAREPLSPHEAEVLDGLMLGDGSLSMGGHSKHACLHITRATKDFEYLQWTADVFKARLTAASLRSRKISDARTRKTYESSRLRTRCDPVFTEERHRWYPGGIKQVPSDLRLSALTIAVWLADDGSVSRASRRSAEIKFATHGFEERDVRRLACLLAGRYGTPFPVYQEGRLEQYTIRAFGDSVRSLLRDIDPVFPPLTRKSDRWRNSELLDKRATPPACPRCDSPHVYRWARTRGGTQRFKCMTCMRVFLETYQRPGWDPRQKVSAA